MKADDLMEKIAEAIYHFVHRGSVNYIPWQKLSHKYGRAQYILIATQILQAFKQAGGVLLAEEQELPKMHPNTQWPESIAYKQAQQDMAGFKRVEEI